MTRKTIKVYDPEDDASLRMIDDSERCYGVNLYARGIHEIQVVLCMDKRLLLRWAKRVVAHLEGQGVSE